MISYEIISVVEDNAKTVEVKYLYRTGEVTTETEYPNGPKDPQEITRFRATGVLSTEKDALPKGSKLDYIKKDIATRMGAKSVLEKQEIVAEQKIIASEVVEKVVASEVIVEKV